MAPTTEAIPQYQDLLANPIPQHQYTNGHLDPNINLALEINQRRRHPPNRYNPDEEAEEKSIEEEREMGNNEHEHIQTKPNSQTLKLTFS